MGLKCRIQKNNNGSLTVFSENGQISPLYMGLVDYFSSQQNKQRDYSNLSNQEQLIYSQSKYSGNLLEAPNGEISNLSTSQWLLVRTDSFINFYGDWINGNSDLILDENGEPIFSGIQGELNGLSEQSVRDSLSTLSFNNGVQSKALLIWAMANDPVFQENTGVSDSSSVEHVIEIYESFGDTRTLTSQDIDNLIIASDSSDSSTLQLNLNQPIDVDPINKHYNFTQNRDNYVSEEKSPVLIEIRNALEDSNILGVFKQPTATDVINQLNQVYVGNVEIESDIVDLAPNLPQGMSESVLSNPTLQRQLFLMYRAIDNVPVYNFVGGELVEKVTDEFRTTVVNTLYQSVDTDRLLMNLNVLSQITEDIFVTETNIITGLLDSVVSDAAAMNLDIVGLPQLYVNSNYSDFYDYINSLRTLVESINGYYSTVEDINNYVNSHNSFFNIQESVLLRPVRNTDSYPLIIIEGNVDPISLFESNGVIHLYDDVYMAIDKDGLLESTISEQREQLPSHLYEGVDLGSTELRQRMVDFFSQEGDASFSSTEQLALFNMSHYLFSREHSRPPLRSDEIATQLENLETYDNLNELQGTFPSQFYNFILNQKLNDTELYNRFLKYFYVDNSGLQIRGYDYSLRTSIVNWAEKIPQLTELYDYASLTQNQSLLNIFNYQSYGSVNESQLLYSAVLNPEYVPNFTGNYTKQITGEIKTDYYIGDVIRVDDRLYKIVNRVENMYSPDLNSIVQESYNVLPVTTQIFYGDTAPLSPSQLEEINQQIDECS